MLKIKKMLSAVIIVQLLTCSVFAADVPAAKSEFNLQEITLPSEVKDLGKSSGAIYYSTSVKNKVLVPVHIWGEVKQAGLHFVPSDTTLVKGLSLAGGPTNLAKLENITLTRATPDGAFKEIDFDLSEGGDTKAHQFKIESGDAIFVKKDRFYENRSYYTSLIGIAITVISTFFIVQKID